MTDVFGTALQDFFHQTQTEPLWLQTNDDPDWEEMPLEVFFRQEHELTLIEKMALHHCKGSILDVGAGAGAISLILQNRFTSVSALEINKKACELMQKLGVKNVIHDDIFSFPSKQKFDTILMLMNGIGLCGKLKQLPKLLEKCKTLLNPGGQIIFDSSNIAYLYENHLPETHYFGEINFSYHYKKHSTPTFHWLYIDYKTMKNEAKKLGFSCELLLQNTDDEYVTKLIL